MEETLKAIARMTILADTTNVPGHMHGQQLDKIKAIGQAVLNTRKTVDHVQMWGTPPDEPVKPTETIEAVESTEEGA